METVIVDAKTEDIPNNLPQADPAVKVQTPMPSTQSNPADVKQTPPQSTTSQPTTTPTPEKKLMSARFAVAQLCKRNVAMNWVCIIGMVSTIVSPYLYIVYLKIGIVFMTFIIFLLFVFLAHSLFTNAKLISKYKITKEDYKMKQDTYYEPKGTTGSSS